MKRILLSLMLLIGMGTSLEAGDFEDSRKFCDAGDVYACGALGFMYQYGEGIKQDDLKAVKYYTKACDGSYACGALGHMYQKGKGVRQSYSKGKELYGKACDVGDAIGCENYARLNKK